MTSEDQLCFLFSAVAIFNRRALNLLHGVFYSFLLVPHIWLRCIGTQINLAHEHKIHIQKRKIEKKEPINCRVFVVADPSVSFQVRVRCY